MPDVSGFVKVTALDAKVKELLTNYLNLVI